MPDVVVVGAGPVGSLLALTLARRGYGVDLYERRPDLRSTGAAAGRSINLAVSTRGLHALHEVGLDEDVLRESIPMLGRMTHALDGKLALLLYGRGDERINSMSRTGLTRLLMTRAEETGRVRIHFEQRLLDYDFQRRVARFSSGAEVRAEVIIGTDGSASALRASMDLDVSQDLLSHGYKELTLPPTPHGDFAMHANALHIWPRGAFMLIALPNLDRSFTCTLFLALEGSPSLAKLATESAARRFLERHFPDAMQLAPGFPGQLVAAPVGRMVTVRASPWSRGSALILGDAAHCIVPFFGQGMNAGFEDVSLLAGMLSGNWARDFAAFSALRKPDTDAIADLALENYVEMRDKVADEEFLRLRAIEQELQDRMAGRYLTRYQLVTFTRVPYRIAQRVGQIQQQILGGLARGEYDFARAEEMVSERISPLIP
ncbi:MAG TPA: NAD(P)/FAD-dependent oxidoreductase [Myxococcales bacterium]|nr:NAD(P)/FAD-dependent oxidoreductase [Myxococcales bacterium]